MSGRFFARPSPSDTSWSSLDLWPIRLLGDLASRAFLELVSCWLEMGKWELAEIWVGSKIKIIGKIGIAVHGFGVPMNNGLFQALAMIAITVACGGSACGSIVLQPTRYLGQAVQQMSGISSEMLAAEAGAGAASRHLDDGRPERRSAPHVPARGPGLYQPAHGGAMEGAGGVPSFRTVHGEYVMAAVTGLPQQDPLIDRIRGECKLILMSADPRGLLRPPEFMKLQSSLS